MPNWHIIKVECTDLATPAGIAQLVQFIQHQDGRPFILIGQDEDLLLPSFKVVEETAATLNFTLNRNTANYSVLSASIIQFTQASKVDWDRSKRCLDAYLLTLPHGAVPIVIGQHCAANQAGDNFPALTGEYEAAIFSHLLSAPNLTLLGHAAGVWSADPAFVTDAFILDHLSLQEAAELAYPNSRVLQPESLIPLRDMDIAIRIRPLSPLSAAGTVITPSSPESELLVKGVVAQSDMALIIIEGLGMQGISGITAHAFKALASQMINVVLLSQASTEQSIGIVISKDEKESAILLLEQAFQGRLDAGDISRIYALDNVGIVTIVDDRMRYKPGLTGKMFSTLGRSGINVLTIADGASESNLSAVVAGDDVSAAVNALHEAFCYSRRVAHVFMFGAGTIGGQLLTLMEQQAENWLRDLNLKIRLVGLSNSRHMIWNKGGIPFNAAFDELQKAGQPLIVETIFDHLINSRLDRLIVIDATASDEITNTYPELLRHNIAVVTPNKKANTRSFAYYEELHAAARIHQVPYFYETTVGAGLPVISTLRDLIRSGDEILQIEGVVSGTLSFLFNNMGDGASFADALQSAYDQGYTEPDPRDDLSGEDVARKMLILAREAGLPIERSDIQITPLLSEEIMQLPLDQFMSEFKDHLSTWTPDIGLAPGQRVHFVGRVKDGHIDIGLQAVDPGAAFASLHGTENMIIFTTRRYFDTPLIIRGPGAGPAVTAGGVLADLIRAAELVT